MLLVTDANASRSGRRCRSCSPSRPSTTASSRPGCGTLATLLVESDEPREVHHFACLLGYGAEAVCPRLALQTVAALADADRLGADRPDPAEAQLRFRRAVEDGVLKVMSKMGISDVAGYCGAAVRRARARPGSSSVLPRHAVGARRLGLPSSRRRRSRAPSAAADAPPAREPRLREVPQGRRAARDQPSTRAVDGRMRARTRCAVRNGAGRTRYDRFAALVNGREPMELRDLLELVRPAPVPLDEVEPVEDDRAPLLGGRHVPRRALRRGARDDRARVQQPRRPLELRRGRRGARRASAPSANSRIKQVASGRFGVTAEYAAFARRAPDQDRAGLEARRGRPAARPQGHRGDRAPAPHAARRGAHLAAAAPRHLLDRGPRAARSSTCGR